MTDLNEETVRDALREVIDPEVGVNVVDLGLVYGIVIEGNRVRITMTMTTPACPLGPMITDDAAQAIRKRLPECEDVHVELVWDPPWSAEMMSADAKKQLGWG